jgi:type I restriction enzyme R subunit
MIEFKQIIGRGTRLFDGKDYFTIYDFVEAYRMFFDDDWDGEPLDPVEPGAKPEPENDQGPEAGSDSGQDQDPNPKKIQIKLRDGKARSIQHMSATTFFDADGKPMSAEGFIASLYDTLQLPEFFGNEERLREIWSLPTTRIQLLNKLDEAGFSRQSLRDIQKLIDAERSDLFDVLEYIAFAQDPMTRAERVHVSRVSIESSLQPEQLEFVEFVLSKYVESGVDELGPDKLATLLELKYKSLTEGVSALGDIATAHTVFVEFQRHLYEQKESRSGLAG